MGTYKNKLRLSHNFYNHITTQINVNIPKYTYKYNCKYLYFKNVFSLTLNMPINVFGNSSNNSDDKIDTSLFVQKPYL